MLGVRHHHCLGYPDGGLVDVDPGSAVARLTALIDQVQPDTIVTFGPDGFTGHPDHRAVGHWATQAAAVHRSVRVLHAAKTTGWVQTFASLHERLPTSTPATRKV